MILLKYVDNGTFFRQSFLESIRGVLIRSDRNSCVKPEKKESERAVQTPAPSPPPITAGGGCEYQIVSFGKLQNWTHAAHPTPALERCVREGYSETIQQFNKHFSSTGSLSL